MNFMKIAWSDISSIFKNRFIRVSVIAIIIVPLLYSLLYLAAFWDPYSRLDQMPVAVVNSDTGAIKDGENVNYGNDVINKLKNNNQVGWRFVSKSEADKGLKSKKYYSAFYIPKNFSESVVSAKDNKPNQAKITFVSNNKTNFLASQITGKVELELKDQVAENIIDEYTKATFDSLYEVKDGFKQAADGSKELHDGIATLNDNAPKMKDGVAKLTDGANELANGVNTTATDSTGKPLGLKNGATQINSGVQDAKTKLQDGITALNSNKDMLTILEPENVTSAKKLLGDASNLENVDTSMLALVPKLMTPENIQLIGKMGYDVKNADIAKLLNDPNIQALPGLLTQQNIAGMGKLLTDANSLSGIDMTKLAPMISLLDNSSQLGSLMQQAGALANMDMSKLNAISPLLQPANAKELSSLLTNANNLKSINTASMGTFLANQIAGIDKYNTDTTVLRDANTIAPLLQMIDAQYPANGTAVQQATNAQLKAIVNGYFKTVTDTNSSMQASKPVLTSMGTTLSGLGAVQTQLNNDSQLIAGVNSALTTDNVTAINTMLTQLETAQASMKSPETIKAMQAVQTALTPDNILYIKGALNQLTAMKSDLDSNKLNLLAIQGLMAKVKDPSTMATIAKLQTLSDDLNKATPLITALQSQMTPANMAAIASAPKLVNQLTSMQTELKDNNTMLVMAQNALSDGNIELANNLVNSIPDLTSKVNMLADGTQSLQDGINKLSDGTVQLSTGLNTLNSQMPSLVDGASKLNDGSKELSDKLVEGSNKMNKQLVNTSSDMGKFVSKPVALNDKPINEVKNYGTGFTPYFIPLSLWVGAIMMFFVITDKVDDSIKASSASVVAGKFISYGFIGTLQAVLVSIVVMMLGLVPTNIPLYFLFNIFMSFVFIAIIQCLVFLMGQVGRLLSIVLLIFQLTACAGTFPLELVPKFFKVLNPLMPFTYCVAALREVISGSDYTLVFKNMGILAVVMFVFLFISMIMKGHADKVQSLIEQKKEEESVRTA